MRSISLLLLCACMTAYEPGALLSKRGQTGTVGGVDVAVSRRVSNRPEWILLEFELGNLRDRKVPIDLRAVEVSIDGRQAKVFDPRDELHVAWLGPRSHVRERVFFRGASAEWMHACVVLHEFVIGAPDERRRCFNSYETVER